MAEIILILNNYDLRKVEAEVMRGEKPAHHLFGTDRLRAKGFKLEEISCRNEGFLGKIQTFLRRIRFPIPLGNLPQQWKAWKRRNHADLLYAPCQTQTQVLAWLRALGLFPLPMVCLAHHPIETGRLHWVRYPFVVLEMRGADYYLSLSKKVAAEIARLKGNDIPGMHMKWGPDLDFYPAPDFKPGSGFVAAGRTGRDFSTFGRGAAMAGVNAAIYCLDSNLEPSFDEFSGRVQVNAFAGEADWNYRVQMPVYQSARALAIPLSSTDNMTGLTSLADALAMGKPVIVTRNKFIDLDIEAEGIGRWVEKGDVKGWADALRWFDDHPDEAVAMGRRGRRIAEQGWNYQEFCGTLCSLAAGI